jgi:hypothetical protein
VLALALGNVALVGPTLDSRIMPYAQLAAFGAPLAIGLLTFFWGVRRASRTA